MKPVDHFILEVARRFRFVEQRKLNTEDIGAVTAAAFVILHVFTTEQRDALRAALEEVAGLPPSCSRG